MEQFSFKSSYMKSVTLFKSTIVVTVSYTHLTLPTIA